MDVQSARLMTINAAEKVANGDPDVRTAISAIKVFVPAAYHRVVDRAIQVWGGAGVSNDLPAGPDVPHRPGPPAGRRPR